MNKYFEGIKKNFGFGCMRLPMKNDEVDHEQFCEMVDTFIENGFNYFDTAHGYVSKKSEPALKEALVKRYSRDKYIFTNKLSTHFFDSEEEIIPLFNKQLEACGLEYFDFYLMHAQSEEIYEKFKKCNAYNVARKLRDAGKFKHLGISFHDKADVLEKILIENPDIEVVQIQFNYLDYDDPSVQSKLCYEVCRKYNKPMIIMEPVKGGTLSNLQEDAKMVFDKIGDASYASYATRFAASFEGVMMVLSGMSNLEQMNDNISYMKDFKEINDTEKLAIKEVVDIYKSLSMIKCTACEYCLSECPQNILIPNLFATMNAKKIHNDWNSSYYYNNVYTVNNGKASDCIKCGMCESVCPQHLEIRNLLEDVANEFETSN